jgi:hypothetical protein
MKITISAKQASASSSRSRRRARNARVADMADDTYSLEDFAELMERPEFTKFVNSELAAHISAKGQNNGLTDESYIQLVQWLSTYLNHDQVPDKVGRMGEEPKATNQSPIVNPRGGLRPEL